MEEWERLMVMLDDHNINDLGDSFCWVLDKSGKYSTRSMHKRLAFWGVINRRMLRLWKSKLPQKLKNFSWLVYQDRLQTGVNLKHRKWRGDERCCVCGVKEDMDHIFFHCHIARVVWYCIKEVLGWDKSPKSVREVFEERIPLGGRDYHIKLFMFTIITWGLWIVRNKMGIPGLFPKSSNEVFLKIFNLFQKWKILLKEQDARYADDKIKRMKIWLSTFWRRIKVYEWKECGG